MRITSEKTPRFIPPFLIKTLKITYLKLEKLSRIYGKHNEIRNLECDHIIGKTDTIFHSIRKLTLPIYKHDYVHFETWCKLFPNLEKLVINSVIQPTNPLVLDSTSLYSLPNLKTIYTIGISLINHHLIPATVSSLITFCKLEDLQGLIDSLSSTSITILKILTISTCTISSASIILSSSAKINTFMLYSECSRDMHTLTLTLLKDMKDVAIVNYGTCTIHSEFNIGNLTIENTTNKIKVKGIDNFSYHLRDKASISIEETNIKSTLLYPSDNSFSDIPPSLLNIPLQIIFVIQCKFPFEEAIRNFYNSLSPSMKVDMIYDSKNWIIDYNGYYESHSVIKDIICLQTPKKRKS